MSAAATGRLGPPDKGILRLAAPLIVSFTLREAFSLVDSVYASQLPGVSDEALAAIGLFMPLQFLMIACWVGTSNGLTARLSAAMGAGEGAKIEQLKRASLRIIASLIGIFLAVAGLAYLAAGEYAPDPVTAEQFRIYAPLVLAGMGLTAYWSILPDSIVKAHHDTQTTMWAGLLSALSNVVLNTLFVYGFHWGIAGIALATGVSRFPSLAFALWRARRHERNRVAGGGYDEPGVERHPVRSILRIAVPSGITFIVMSIESIVLLSLLKREPDATALVATWGLYDRSVRFMAMPLIALSVAMLPFSARLWGRRNVAGIRAGIRISSAAGAIYVLGLVAPVAWLSSDWVAVKLADAPATREALQIALRFLPVTVLAMAPGFLLKSAFEGMHNPRPGLVVAIIRSAVLVIPLTYAGLRLAPAWGTEPIAGACTGYTLGLGIGSVLLATWLVRFLASADEPPQAR